MGVVENMKEVADLIKKVGDADLYRKLVNLEGEVIDLTRENRQLQHKVDELTEALRMSKVLVFRDPYYWAEGDPAPYCSACWDSKKLAVRIVTVKHPMLSDQRQCPSCKHLYEGGRL